VSSGQASWVSSGDASLHVTCHLPTSPYRDQCIVVVPPVGHEYTHSHSSVRLLCEQLCTAGFPVARFDLEGTGNSCGDKPPETILAAWVRNVADVLAWLKALTGCQSTGIVGLRMGASIAALYTQNHPVRNLLLWAPCMHGGTFLRDCQMIGTASQYKKDTGKLDCGGIVLDVDAQNDIAGFRLDRIVPSAERIFLLDRDDAPSGAAVRDWLQLTSVELTTTTQPQYAQMMRQSMHSLVPIDSIKEMVVWFSADEIAHRGKTGKLTELSPAPYAPNPRNEVFCQFGVNGLFGILCRPTNRISSELESRRTDVVVIPNAGGGHHVGPCNLHVCLARALADAGIASFRFDLRNLGDSVTGMPPTVDQPYPREAWQDLSIVLDELHAEYGFSRFAVAGLCSGAFNGFRALNRYLTGESPHRIALAVLINPSIYYWDERLVTNDCMNASRYEDVVSAYTEQLANTDKFRKLLTGEVDLVCAVTTTVSRMATKLQSTAFGMLDRAGVTKSRIAQDIEAAAVRGCRVQVFAADGDPALAILRNLGGHSVQRLIDNGTLPVTTLSGADHVFSTAESRDRLVNALVNDIDATLLNLT
jgi:pimeloyl-ACP methyl ester carboxylesterase